MTEQKPGSELRSSLASARELSADLRSDLPNSGDAAAGTLESDLHDISLTLFGAQASTGKAVFAAGRMIVNDAEERRYLLHEQQKRESQEARELANLARWNAQMTTVGGVQMTNEQAQRARQNVIDNDQAYADWAVRKGLINEDQREEFKAGVRRKKELEDKRGRGTLATGEAAEEAQLNQSRVGRAIDSATAYDFQHQGNTPAPEATADARLRSSSSTALDRSTLFQSAPIANTAFNTASNADPLQKPPPTQQVSPSIKATGLDL